MHMLFNKRLEKEKHDEEKEGGNSLNKGQKVELDTEVETMQGPTWLAADQRLAHFYTRRYMVTTPCCWKQRPYGSMINDQVFVCLLTNLMRLVALQYALMLAYYSNTS